MAEGMEWVDPGGGTVSLSSGVSLADEGELGMPPNKHYVIRGAQQHGATRQGFKLDPRIINLLFYKKDTSRENFFTNRQTYLATFRPWTSTGILRKELPCGTKYELDCHYNRGLSLGRRDQVSAYSQKFAVQLIAFDPVWRKMPINTQSFALSALTELEFSITFPITFGSGVIDESVTVQNGGTWESYPQIVITGPLTNPIITNSSTGEKIQMTYAIGASEVVTIDTAPGVKTITNGSGTNLISKMSSDSDLGTFHLAADPEVASGNNSIRVQGSAADSATTDITMKWYDKYIGI